MNKLVEPLGRSPTHFGWSTLVHPVIGILNYKFRGTDLLNGWYYVTWGLIVVDKFRLPDYWQRRYRIMCIWFWGTSTNGHAGQRSVYFRIADTKIADRFWRLRVLAEIQDIPTVESLNQTGTLNKLCQLWGWTPARHPNPSDQSCPGHALLLVVEAFKSPRTSSFPETFTSLKAAKDFRISSARLGRPDLMMMMMMRRMVGLKRPRHHPICPKIVELASKEIVLFIFAMFEGAGRTNPLRDLNAKSPDGKCWVFKLSQAPLICTIAHIWLLL